MGERIRQRAKGASALGSNPQEAFASPAVGRSPYREMTMHFRPALIFAAAFFVLATNLTSAAAAPNLTRWFFHATSFDPTGSQYKLTAPDFLPGHSLASMCAVWRSYGAAKNPVLFAAVWDLVAYDRKHQIALASANTDQCSVAVFEAPKPGVAAHDMDLSSYATGRGIRIGSSASAVHTAYGGPAITGSHVARRYAAMVPDFTVTIPRKRVLLPELITLVIDSGRVSSITAYVDLGGEF